LKIVIGTNFLPPKIGGIERHTHELAKALIDLGHVVEVVTAGWPYVTLAPSSQVVQPIYKVIEIPSVVLKERLPFPKFWGSTFWKVLKHGDSHPDLLVLQSHLFVSNWILAVVHRKTKRIVWINHGTNYVGMDSRFFTIISWCYEKIGIGIMSRFVNEFWAQSQSACEWAQSQTKIPFHEIPNAISLRAFKEKSSKEYSSKRKILFVGRLIADKYPFECLEGFNNLIKKFEFQDIFYQVIGSGPELPRLIRYAGENDLNVNFIGEADHAKVLEMMSDSEILIQAFPHTEGNTTVVLEALASGMKVVSTPFGGGREWDEVKNIYVADFQKLHLGLLHALENNKSREDMLKSGMLAVKQGHVWDQVANRLLKGPDANLNLSTTG
jgi:glycosyltransferase involved in cell wall biosynthesis